MKSAYEYQDPIDRGYKKFRLTRKQHKDLLKYRKRNWKFRYEYYYDGRGIIVHQFYSLLFVAVNTVLFPVTLLFYGIGNAKECFMDFTNLYSQKKHGQFITDTIAAKSELYTEIIKIAEKKISNK